MTAVLTALGNRWEAQVATVLESSTRVRVARRCADLADLMATAAAGLGSSALVSDDLRGLDLTAVDRLRSIGLQVVGLSAPDDEGSERRLRQMGVRTVVPATSVLSRLEAALLESPLPESALLESALLQSPGPALPSAPPGSAPPGSALPGSPRARQDGGADERAGPGGASPRGCVVAVWGPTGAPGRTTVAVNLAAEVAGLGLATVLVDADTYGGSVAQTLSLLDEAPGLVAAVRGADQGTLDLPALARLAPEVSPGLRVLTGIPKAERWPEVRAAALERVLDLARSLARVVVVDCGFNLEADEELTYDTQVPRSNAATLTTLSVADAVVAVGGCDPVSLQRLVRGLQELGTVQSPRPCVVVNRVRSAAVGARPQARVRAALGRFAGVEEVRFIPDDPGGLDAAMLAGRTLAECVPRSPARAALTELAAALTDRAAARTTPGRARWHLTR